MTHLNEADTFVKYLKNLNLDDKMRMINSEKSFPIQKAKILIKKQE
jgi:hypothetical protein